MFVNATQSPSLGGMCGDLMFIIDNRLSKKKKIIGANEMDWQVGATCPNGKVEKNPGI